MARHERGRALSLDGGDPSVYPLSAHETQIDLHGRYRPPLGVVGDAVDALVGHRLAEASVLRFVADSATRINAELGVRAGAPPSGTPIAE